MIQRGEVYRHKKNHSEKLPSTLISHVWRSSRVSTVYIKYTGPNPPSCYMLLDTKKKCFILLDGESSFFFVFFFYFCYFFFLLLNEASQDYLLKLQCFVLPTIAA